jgi:hypothetical protein
MMKKLLFILSAAITSTVQATIIPVPAQYSTIQEAINASVNGDTVEVSPGTYYENINFREKNIVLTSLYYLSGDTAYISSTIINGGAPVITDSASCVIIAGGQDTATVLQGFTLTGGLGTRWQDIHNAGFYREGGGILIELSSPTIQHNIIIDNHITNLATVINTGGGGIRIGDGNPVIQNNLILYNEAVYGPGIVLNYTAVRIRNNIIASNYGGQNYYGGSGIWMVGDFGTVPKIIENNTIINNTCVVANGTGGILVWGSLSVIIRNNIIRGNVPATQLKNVQGAATIAYNISSGSIPGTANIYADPMLDPQCNMPMTGSPSIDAGDSSVIYNDLVIAPGTAAWPSSGTERNDIGAFGGPYASVLNCVFSLSGVDEMNATEKTLSVYPNPAKDILYISSKNKIESAEIINAEGKLITAYPVINTSLSLKGIAKGFYILKIQYADKNIENKKIQIE